jgi:hypothetical protein
LALEIVDLALERLDALFLVLVDLGDQLLVRLVYLLFCFSASKLHLVSQANTMISNGVDSID